MEIKSDVFGAHQAELDTHTARIIWESEGAGYSLNKQERRQVTMPWANAEYVPRIKRVKPGEFNHS